MDTDITNFGCESLVSWTTGLIERIAEKEIQMRKYRGLTKEGKWVYGNYIYLRHDDNTETHLIQVIDAKYYSSPEYNRGWSHDRFKVIPETVGQFTGLKDKNGKNGVYEDDAIYFSMSETQHYKGYVKWSDKGLCYIVECFWQKQDEIPHLCDGYEMNFQYQTTCVRRLDSDCFDIEIIGNIHQPKLMEKENV